MTLFDTLVVDFSSSLYYSVNGVLISVHYSLSSLIVQALSLTTQAGVP